jgi:acyl carrier protein
VSLAGERLQAGTPLFSSGIVDSFGVLELIAFLEETFGIVIDPARHELGELDSVDRIVALVTSLDHGRGGR